MLSSFCWWELFLLIIIKVGDIIKILALIFIFIGIIILLKYLLTTKTKIDKSFLEEDTLEEKEEKDDDGISEMFAQKGSILLMIGLFLIFIAIIIYIALGGFIKWKRN